MFQIDNSTAASSQPASTAPGAPGFFTDGNPASSTPATVVPAEWLNSVMMELINAVKAGGQIPSKAVFNQLALGMLSLGSPYAADSSSTANQIVVAFPTGYVRNEGQMVRIKVAQSNTGPVTINDGIGTGTVPLVGGAHAALQGGELVAGGDMFAFWNSSIGSAPGSYVLAEGLGGAVQVATATKSQHAVTLGQVSSMISGMFSINAGAVAGNALTVGYPAQNITFRSSTLTSGTPSVIAAAAGSLTIPSGATLGTVSGQQSTVVLLALNNGGTVEPAVVNLSGGVDLSETGLISTTAISSSATAANVVYSANARSNVPYKVMGAYYITEATAGTWASAPTQAVGAGGEAFSQMMSIGYSQTWKNVTASRALGTTYYNTTSRPIFVYVSVSGGVTGATFVVNGVALPIWIPNTSSANQGSFIVPPEASYVVPAAGSVGIGSWYELR